MHCEHSRKRSREQHKAKWTDSMSVLFVTRTLAHIHISDTYNTFWFCSGNRTHTPIQVSECEWAQVHVCVWVCVVYATNMPFPLWMHFPFYEMLLSKSSICSNGLAFCFFFLSLVPFFMHFRFLPLDSWCMRKHLLTKCYTCISIQFLIFAPSLQLHLDSHRHWRWQPMVRMRIVAKTFHESVLSHSLFEFMSLAFSLSLSLCMTVCSTSTCMTQNRTNLFKYEFLFLSKIRRINSQTEHSACTSFL